jgi:hypothetical protein
VEIRIVGADERAVYRVQQVRNRDEWNLGGEQHEQQRGDDGDVAPR